MTADAFHVKDVTSWSVEKGLEWIGFCLLNCKGNGDTLAWINFEIKIVNMCWVIIFIFSESKYPSKNNGMITM